MQTMEPVGIEPVRQAPAIRCRQIPSFNCTDLASVRRAFAGASSCQFQQSWLGTSSANFAPAEVRLGWQNNSLLIFAELTDGDIFNTASRAGQHLWELGDVFEVFLRPAATESYAEFQIAPDNQRLQLRFPNGRALEQFRKTNRLEDVIVRDQSFHSVTWIERNLGRWSVYAEIPILAVSGYDGRIENTQWHFSFGRYDYNRGLGEPVISSTSPHAQPDFHRQHEWGILTFINTI